MDENDQQSTPPALEGGQGGESDADATTTDQREPAGPGAADSGDNPAAKPTDVKLDQDPAGVGGVDDDQDTDDRPLPGAYAGLARDPEREFLPGDDVHTVKIGEDDNGEPVYGHHDAAGVRYAL